MTAVRPLPIVTAENEPFFAGLRGRRFVVPRCAACGHFNWTPYPACRSCLSTEQAWTEVSGRGSLYTFSIVHRGPRAFADDGPYVWGFVELEERPRPMLVMGNLLGVPDDEVHIGMAVRIGYHDVPGHDLTLFHFERA